MKSNMQIIQDVKFWADVIDQVAIPANGQRLTKAEQAALFQTCRALAQTALYAAEK